jgi:hypothetical protein
MTGRCRRGGRHRVSACWQSGWPSHSRRTAQSFVAVAAGRQGPDPCNIAMNKGRSRVGPGLIWPHAASQRRPQRRRSGNETRSLSSIWPMQRFECPPRVIITRPISIVWSPDSMVSRCGTTLDGLGSLEARQLRLAAELDGGINPIFEWLGTRPFLARCGVRVAHSQSTPGRGRATSQRKDDLCRSPTSKTCTSASCRS